MKRCVWTTFCFGFPIVSSLAQHQIPMNHARIYSAWLPSVIQSILLSPFQQHYHISERLVKLGRYSFSGSIPPKFEHKLRRHKQSFGKIATTVVLDKDENLL